MAYLDKSRWQKRIREFYDKEMITEDQQDSLLDMINSPDEENVSMVELVAKTYIKDTLTKNLNEEQKASFMDIIEHFDNPQHSAVVLKGYAGTGKTFLVKKIIEYIMQTEPNAKMAITAPTNKAVKVLYANSAANAFSNEAYMFEDIFESDSRLIYCTTHKFLGMKEIITDDGKQIFQADTMNKSKLDTFNYLLVDEVSMLDDKLTATMLDGKKIKILFIGDPAQIPPVNKADSIPLLGNSRVYTFKETHLTQIMRQKGKNPIIEHSFTIRQNLNNPKPIPFVKNELNDDGGVEVIKPERDSPILRQIIKKYVSSPNYKKNADYFKVLAWRRASVTRINNIIREQLYGLNPPRFVIGEKIIAQKPLFQKEIYKPKKGKARTYWKVKISNSEEMVIDKIASGTLTIQYFKQIRVFDAYQLTVSYVNMEGNTCNQTIKVIHESQEKEYFQMLESIKDNAKAAGRASLWVMYFDYLKYSADIAYNYALTVHKSQGSTYENVLVLEDDIDMNHKTVEKNRIRYTAYTRASKKLYLLRTQESMKEAYKDYRTEDYTSCGPT